VRARLGAHCVGVQLAARATAALGLVHRDVGVAEQLDGGFLAADAVQVRGEADSDADADGELDLDAVHHDAPAERVADALGEIERGVLVDVPSHSTTNSSPPMRATTSEGRVAWEMRLPPVPAARRPRRDRPCR
jgi:hypothetical protein